MPRKPYEQLYGPTFHVTPVDLCILFQCNIYILYYAIFMSCGNKIVFCFKLFQIYLNYNSECPQRYKNATIHALIHRTSQDLI